MPPPPVGYGDSPDNGYNPWMQPPGQVNRDFAFQCEVCNNAVFSTFQECAEHEEECARRHRVDASPSPLGKENVAHAGAAATKTYPQQPPQSLLESEVPKAAGKVSTGSPTKPKASPSPNSKKKGEDEERKATRAAVEAVLLLRGVNE